jgi:hypothetical protein
MKHTRFKWARAFKLLARHHKQQSRKLSKLETRKKK